MRNLLFTFVMLMGILPLKAQVNPQAGYVITNDNDTLLDIGATMLNFDAIASQQDQVDWTMGSPGGTEDLGIPEHYEVVAYYDWD